EGSRVVLTRSDGGVTVSIPYGEDANTLSFGGGDDRDLVFVDGEVRIGDTVLEGGVDNDLDGGSGSDFEFTTGVDDLEGTSGDDVFEAGLGLGIDGLVGVQTLQGPYTANGGAGTDTLLAELNSTGTTQNPTLEGIEIYRLTSFGTLVGPGGESTLNLSRSSGYEQLWNDDSTGDLTLLNVGEVATLGLDGVQGGTTYTVNYDNIEVEEQNVVAI